jgi:breast cancer 2 susceptibility protein
VRSHFNACSVPTVPKHSRNHLRLDSPPNTVEDMLLALEESCTSASCHESSSAIIARTTRAEAGWLARAIRNKLAQDRENISEDIQIELQVSYPLK